MVPINNCRYHFTNITEVYLFGTWAMMLVVEALTVPLSTAVCPLFGGMEDMLSKGSWGLLAEDSI